MLSVEDTRVVRALKAGDESAFERLMREYHAALLRVAQIYVSTLAVAEEVVQETWLAVLNGIDRFEGRSSLKTWLFRILTNRAKTRGERESRSVPFSSIGEAAEHPAHRVHGHVVRRERGDDEPGANQVEPHLG